MPRRPLVRAACGHPRSPPSVGGGAAPLSLLLLLGAVAWFAARVGPLGAFVVAGGRPFLLGRSSPASSPSSAVSRQAQNLAGGGVPGEDPDVGRGENFNIWDADLPDSFEEEDGDDDEEVEEPPRRQEREARRTAPRPPPRDGGVDYNRREEDRPPRQQGGLGGRNGYFDQGDYKRRKEQAPERGSFNDDEEEEDSFDLKDLSQYEEFESEAEGNGVYPEDTDYYGRNVDVETTSRTHTFNKFLRVNDERREEQEGDGRGREQIRDRRFEPQKAEDFAPRPVTHRELKSLRGKTREMWRPDRPTGLAGVVQARLVDATTLQELLDEISAHNDTAMKEWQPGTVATAFHRLAKLSIGRFHFTAVADARKRLTSEMRRRPASDYDNIQLASIMWAFGKFRSRLREAMENQFLDEVLLRVDEFEPRSLASVIYGMGRMEWKNVEILQRVGDQMTEPDRLFDFSSQHITNIVYAMGRVNFRHDGMLRAVAKFSAPRLKQFKTQELSNMIYAMSKLRYRHRGFLDSFCDFVPTRLKWFNPQNLENTLTAMLVLRHPHEYFINALTTHMQGMSETWRRRKSLTKNMVRLEEFQLILSGSGAAQQPKRRPQRRWEGEEEEPPRRREEALRQEDLVDGEEGEYLEQVMEQKKNPMDFLL